MDNIQMDIQKWDACMDCFALAQYRDRWLALVNPVMNLQVP